MVNKDYYDILGVKKNAELNDIKKAYKRLAIKYHPDRNKGDKILEEKFKEVKEAYEILSDSKKRSMYDQYGHSAFNQDNYSSNYDSDFTSSNDFSDIFGDVFGDIFGTKSKSQNKQKVGSDISYDMDLTLEEVFKGVSKEIGINVIDKCKICNGSGCRPGTKRKVCDMCNGKGIINTRQGFFTIQQTCPKCNGYTYIIDNVCYVCRGSGNNKIFKKLFIKIPVGINSNDRIRLVGKGNYGGYNSKYGDLYINIKIKDHPLFIRKKNDLYCKLPINFTIAALGGYIEIPYFNNLIKFKIPPETQSGKLFRIKNKGIRFYKSNRYGDLLCKIIVETPINLDHYQKKLLYKFGLSLDKNIDNNPKYKKFINYIKIFFDSII